MAQNAITILITSIPIFCYAQLSLNLGPDVYYSPDDLRDCELKSDPTEKGYKIDDYLYVSIMDIDQISEEVMEYRLHGYIVDQWKNPMLNLTIVNNYLKSKNKPVFLPNSLAKCMWKPDIIFPNSKEIIIFEHMVPNRSFKLMPDGTIYRVERYLIKASCPMKFQLFPLDFQHCIFKIGLRKGVVKGKVPPPLHKIVDIFVHNPDERVELHWSNEPGSPKTMNGFNPFKMIYQVEPLHFQFKNPRAAKKVEKWHTGTYTELWGNFTLYRRLTGSVVNLYFPSTMIVLLSFLSFWIDVSAAPARVSLGVTALLTIATQIVQSRTLLPPVHYITGLDVWLFACLSLIFGSVVEYGIAYSYRPRSTDNNKIIESKEASTRIQDKYSPGKAWYPSNTQISTLTVSDQNPDMASQRSNLTRKAKNLSLGQKSNILVGSSNPFDKVCKWLFPSLFFTFSIVYCTVLSILAY